MSTIHLTEADQDAWVNYKPATDPIQFDAFAIRHAFMAGRISCRPEPCTHCKSTLHRTEACDDISKHKQSKLCPPDALGDPEQEEAAQFAEDVFEENYYGQD